MGGEINKKSPTAMRMLKFGFNLPDDGMVGQQLFAGEATRMLYATDEAQEGRKAFLEKRDPDYSKIPLVLLTGKLQLGGAPTRRSTSCFLSKRARAPRSTVRACSKTPAASRASTTEGGGRIGDSCLEAGTHRAVHALRELDGVGQVRSEVGHVCEQLSKGDRLADATLVGCDQRAAFGLAQREQIIEVDLLRLASQSGHPRDVHPAASEKEQAS